ncbi:excinuclease ABC subunit B, partial [Staphylococcus cohnii]
IEDQNLEEAAIVRDENKALKDDGEVKHDE